MRSHSDIPATWHQQAAIAGTRFTYLRGKEGWVDLGGWLDTVFQKVVHQAHIDNFAILTDFQNSFT